MTHTGRPNIVCSGSLNSPFSFQFGNIENKRLLVLQGEIVILMCGKENVCFL